MPRKTRYFYGDKAVEDAIDDVILPENTLQDDDDTHVDSSHARKKMKATHTTNSFVSTASILNVCKKKCTAEEIMEEGMAEGMAERAMEVDKPN